MTNSKAEVGPIVQAIPSWLGVLATACFAASVVYDWGFSSALGLGLTEIPSTLADHSKSALEWLPALSVAMVAIAAFEFTGRRLGGNLPDDEVISSSKNPARTAQIINGVRNFSFLFVVCVSLYGFLDRGELQAMMLATAIAVIWANFAAWMLERDPPIARWIWIGLIGGPCAGIFLFALGWNAATYGLRKPTDASAIEFESGRAETITVLRYYEDGLLYRNEDKLFFTRWSAISTVNPGGDTHLWLGLDCSLDGCRSSNSPPTR